MPSRLRHVLCAVAFVLASLASARVNAAPDPCERAAPLALDLRFHAGARPTTAPVLAADGSVYIGTAEGYVHALGPDGSYLWGYTLRGPVVGDLALGATATLLVPTPRRVYALRPDGTLLWVFESPIAVHAGLAPDGTGRYFFASDDGRLFALSGRGALVAHVPGKVPFSSAPVGLGAELGVGVARSDGSAVLALGFKTQRFELGVSARELFACQGVAFCALAGDAVFGVARDGVRFRYPALRGAAHGERVAVIDEQRRLGVYAAGQLVFTSAVEGDVSAAPLVDPRGRVYVPLESGALLAFSERGALQGCLKVADSPLGTPVFDAARERVWVTAREGWLAAVEAH